MSKLLKIENEPTTEWMRPAGPWTVQRPTCLLNGAFDLFTLGHMRLVRQAKARAATVVVALDSDQKVFGSKGPGRPVMCFAERAAALGFMDVDYVVEIDTEKDMKTLVESLRPDFRIQGSDYLDRPSRFAVPKLFLRRTRKSISTSTLIERCKLVP